MNRLQTPKRAIKAQKPKQKVALKQPKRSVLKTTKRGFASPYNPSVPHPAAEMPLGDSAFTSTSLYACEPEMTYGGALSFLRRKYSRNVTGHGVNGNERADVVVSGLPYDSAVTYRSGARLGPRAIRAASVQLAELKPYPWAFQPFDHLAVVDSGDAFLDPHNPMTIRGSIVDHARKILNSTGPEKAVKNDSKNTWGDFYSHNKDRTTRMLTFGGDHFVTYPLLQAHAEKYGPMALIHFDAHCDTWGDDSAHPHELNHGTMFRHAANEGMVVPEHSVQIGLRTVNDDYMGFNVLDATWVHNNGVDAVLRKIEDVVAKSKLPVYLTFDIDCLDPSAAPGTGTPVPGGLTSFQALHILRNLRQTGVDVVGADVVEVAPAYDVSEITALAAAHVATDILCMWADGKREAGLGLPLLH
jgi:agmatinase